jgi:hypothetical protein
VVRAALEQDWEAEPPNGIPSQSLGTRQSFKKLSITDFHLNLIRMYFSPPRLRGGVRGGVKTVLHPNANTEQQKHLSKSCIFNAYFLRMNAHSLKGRMDNFRNYIMIAIKQFTCAVVKEWLVFFLSYLEITEIPSRLFVVTVRI